MLNKGLFLSWRSRTRLTEEVVDGRGDVFAEHRSHARQRVKELAGGGDTPPPPGSEMLNKL